MADLTGKKIKNTYKDLLQVSNSNAGVDATLRVVEDGEGTSSALSISSGAIQVDNINIDGNAIISANTNGDITITPNGTGSIVLDGVNWPQADGTNGQALVTDGAGQLSYSSITITALGDISDVTITSIASGEILKWNGSAWVNNTLAEAGIAAVGHTHVEADITDLQNYLLNVVEDTTPQLGGGLDVNGNEITGAIDLHSTGDIIQELGDAAGTNKVIIKDSGAVEVAAIDSDGNITTSGTVDGRDLQTDGTKLDGIEANADVTDSVNVDAAGAVMNTDTTTAAMSFVIDEDNMASDLATKVPTQQSTKAYADTKLANVVEDTTPQLGGGLDVNGNEITGAIDLHSSGDIIQELGDAAGTNKVSIRDSAAIEVAAIDSNGNITTAGTVDGRDVATDGTKLDGIEASADVTDETNVKAALDGATITGAVIAAADKILFQDNNDGDNLRVETFSDFEGILNHDSLTGFVANEHIDWTSTSSNFNTSGSITGTGVVDFGGATSVEIPSGTAPTVNAAGEIAIDTNGDGVTITHGVLKAYDGTNELAIFGTKNTYPSADNDVLAYDSATNSLTWQAQVGAGLANVVDDTTPQLGGQLDVNGNAIGDGTRELLTFTEDASAVNHVNIENEATGSGPIISAAGDDANVDLNIVAKGTGDVKIGVYTFDGDQSVGAGQDNYVLTYDNATGLISLEASAGGGLSNVVEDTTPQLGGQLDVNGNAIGDGTRELLTFTEDASAVNHIEIENEATGSGPILRSTGDDVNVDLNIDTKGTGALNLGSADSTIVLTGTSISGSAIKDEDTMTSNSATHLATQQSIKAYADTKLADIVSDTTPQLGGQLDVNGNAIGDGTRELLTFTEDASAVNHVNIENQATGSGPIISAAGDDANVDLNINAKGTGNISLGNFTFDADQTVGAGQDNYVLTYDNAGGLISLEAATGGAGGDLSLVTVSTASASASIAFTGLTALNYIVRFENLIPATDNASLQLEVSTDNGCTYAAVDYQYIVHAQNESGAENTTGSSIATIGSMMTGSGVGNDTGEFGLSGSANLYNAAKASYPLYVTGELVYMDGTGDIWKNTFAVISADDGAGGSTDEIDAIRFSFTSGNITSGKIYLYSMAVS